MPTLSARTACFGGQGSLVFNVRMRTIRAARGFRVPLALGIFVLDDLGVARRFLFLRGGLCGPQRGSMSRESLGKNTVDLVGPAAIVLDDFVGDIGHRGLYL